MMILRPSVQNDDISFYVNTNKTILYIYNKKNNKIVRHFADKWPSLEMDVVIFDDGEESVKSLNFKTIIDKESDFIKKVNPIASTVKTPAFFKEFDEETMITSNFLNEFLGSETFIESFHNNKYRKNSNVINALKKDTPAFYMLLKNLFFNEKDEVIENFLNWLNVCSFQDRNQDVIFCFFGTTELLQGQGAGKGVLIQLLNELLSGLVVSVSNTTYENNFNSNIMNKKVVVFDEVNFKGLKYESIKDITGSSKLRIEFKGKEPINTDNVSSWLMFSNEHDLHDKITADDRRTFLVRPNPQNGSLKKLFTKKYKSFEGFQEQLNSEKDSIIHIIANSTKKVKTPLELETRAKREYFLQKNELDVIDIKMFYQILSNDQMHKKIIKISKDNNFLDKQTFELLKSKSMNYKLFEIIHARFIEFGFLKKESSLFIWERLKEYSLKNGYVFLNVDMCKSKAFERFKDKILVKKNITNPKELRILKQNFRSKFGKDNLEDVFD